MAGQFHRLTVPAYYTGGGPFPADPGVSYDYLNNAGGGTPSNADGQKVGGPNAGTYLVAFGEDATSNNANRPAKALGENTDHLDDLLHRDLAVVVRTSTATGPSSSVVLPANTYLGPSGTTNNAAGLSTIFEVLDADDNEILDPVSGNKCQVSLATLSGGDAIGSGGFSANAVTLTISPAIPAAVDYRVYYGTRSNLATLPTDALTFIKIRGAQEVDADVQELFRQLHGNNLSWDAAWPSTIWDLTNSGLDGVYRRGSSALLTPPDSYFPQTQDTAGGGGWFRRNGPALSGFILDGFASDVRPGDPANTVFLSRVALTGQNYGAGHVGFTWIGQNRLFSGENTGADALESVSHEVGGFAAMSPRMLTGSVPTDATVLTRILPGTTCTLANVGAFSSLTPFNNEAVVTLTGADNWFRVGGSGGSTWVFLGVDLLELEYTQSGTVRREFVVISALGASNDTTSNVKARVRFLNGKVPDWQAAVTNATVVAWHHRSLLASDSAWEAADEQYNFPEIDSRTLGGSLLVCAPPQVSGVTGGHASRTWNAGIQVFAGTSAYSVQATALSWGGKSAAGALARYGHLCGDGTVVATRYSTTAVTATVSSTPVTQTLDCSLGSAFFVTNTVATASTLVFETANMQVGQELRILMRRTSSSSNIALSWTDAGTGAHAHSSGADQQPNTGAGYDLWVGKVFDISGVPTAFWTVTRY